MWKKILSAGAVSLIAHKMKIWSNFFRRPVYRADPRLWMKVLTEYPTLSFFIIALSYRIVASSFGNNEKSDVVTIRQPISIPHVYALAIFEEVAFRGILRELTKDNAAEISSEIVLGFLYGLYYSMYHPESDTLINFSILGTTYGFGARKYSIGELCLYHCLLNAFMIS